jgi:hypothetical protein
VLTNGFSWSGKGILFIGQGGRSDGLETWKVEMKMTNDNDTLTAPKRFCAGCHTMLPEDTPEMDDDAKFSYENWSKGYYPPWHKQFPAFVDFMYCNNCLISMGRKSKERSWMDKLLGIKHDYYVAPERFRAGITLAIGLLLFIILCAIIGQWIDDHVTFYLY